MQALNRNDFMNFAINFGATTKQIESQFLQFGYSLAKFYSDELNHELLNAFLGNSHGVYKTHAERLVKELRVHGMADGSYTNEITAKQARIDRIKAEWESIYLAWADGLTHKPERKELTEDEKNQRAYEAIEKALKQLRKHHALDTAKILKMVTGV